MGAEFLGGSIMALAEALRERCSVGELVHLPEDKRDRVPSGLVGAGEEAAQDHRAASRLLNGGAACYFKASGGSNAPRI